jgi:hypothetical protein
VRNESQLLAGWFYFVRFTCCPPLVATLNCKAGTLRESLRTRASVSTGWLATVEAKQQIEAVGNELKAREES